MTEQQTAVAEGQDESFEYPISVEDAGPGSKKISVEIPRDRIEKKLKEAFVDLRKQATIPGFRVGHAPQKLIEKRFSTDVRNQVRGDLIRESYEQAIEKNSLQVLGEPQFDDPEKLELPEAGDLKYTFSVEVQPEVNLPDFGAMKIKRPKINIKDENVEQAMNNLREQQGALVPVEDRGVEAKDFLMADVHVKVDGNVVTHQHDAQIISRPGRIAGLDVADLDQKLAGLKAGETRSIPVTVPDTNPNEAIRGKTAEIEIALKDLKRLELAEITPAFLADLGFESADELRAALREQMESKIAEDVQTAMREQVKRYLLENVTIELPQKMSDRQADRVVSRRAVDLMMRGVPKDQVEANLERLRAGAAEEAVRELKLYFILNKLATDHNVDVDEGELNGRIAMIAIQQGLRPEKLKQDMTKDNSLASLYLQMKEQKALDVVLGTANVEDVEVTGTEVPQENAAAETPKSE